MFYSISEISVMSHDHGDDIRRAWGKSRRRKEEKAKTAGRRMLLGMISFFIR